MVLFGLALLRPGISPAFLAIVALVVCYLVEFSQIYQGAWINAIRSSRIGHLVLGSGFDWLDLVAYAVGVVTGVIADVLFFYRTHDVVGARA